MAARSVGSVKTALAVAEDSAAAFISQGGSKMVPPKTDIVWRQILTGEREPKLSALATRLTVARLRQIVRSNPDTTPAAVDELFKYFAANSFAARDLGNL